MGSALNGTGITFSDATTLSTQPVTTFIGQKGAVDPTTLGNLGSIVLAFYRVNTPSSGSPGGINNYVVGTSVAGSSLAYNVYSTTQSFGGYTGTAYAVTAVRLGGSGNVSNIAFPTSGGAVGGSLAVSMQANAGGGSANSLNNSCTYSTLSGTWKSLQPFGVQTFVGCGNTAYWASSLWVRYA